MAQPLASPVFVLRKLIVIALDQYVRNMVAAGAFADIEDEDTYYVSGTLDDTSELERRPGYLGVIDGTTERRNTYRELRKILLASYRFRSRTQRIKLGFMPPVERTLLKLKSLPGPRHVITRRYMRKIGVLPRLHELITELRPDIIIAPSGGTDPLVLDAFRSARELGITTLLIPFNWDNLSSKSAYPILPDYLGVVGPQSVEYAQRIHRVPRERVSLLGAPYIDAYFHREPDSTEPPFPFRYVLFAGCYMPFDERTSLEMLDRQIEEQGLDLKIVYRPHPQRRRRRVPDRVDESGLAHVVIDPQVRDQYLRSFDRDAGERAAAPMPALDYYPALLEHAEFVICPLSTMVLESAIFERQVIVIAYHDGIHKDSPGIIIGYDHFRGMDQVEGLWMCRRAEDLVPMFLRQATDPPALSTRMRSQVSPWIYSDARPYSERLRELVERIGAETGSTRPAAAALSAP